jgi:hypothetical protein
VLIGGRLDSQSHFAPNRRQTRFVLQGLNVANRVGKKKTKSSNIPRLGFWLHPFNLFRQLCAIHSATPEIPLDEIQVSKSEAKLKKTNTTVKYAFVFSFSKMPSSTRETENSVSAFDPGPRIRSVAIGLAMKKL